MTYVYECAAGVEFDVEQRINEPKLTECPCCGNCTPKRLISGTPHFDLRSGPSGGWASQGYSKTEAQRKCNKKLGRT